MRTRTTLAAALLTLAALATGCSSDSSSEDSKPTPAKPSTTAKTYTYADCVDLLEYDFQEDDLQDASDDPECSHLTRARYLDAVGEVLAAHKDEIVDSAQ